MKWEGADGGARSSRDPDAITRVARPDGRATREYLKEQTLTDSQRSGLNRRPLDDGVVAGSEVLRQPCLAVSESLEPAWRCQELVTRDCALNRVAELLD